MNILIFDTSTKFCCISLITDNNLSSFVEEARHDQVLLHNIDNLISKANISLADINLIGCGVGPGSFTGIRISVSLANAFAACLNIPIISFSSLYAIAATAFYKAPTNNKYIVLRDSSSNYLYCGEYVPEGSNLLIHKEYILDKKSSITFTQDIIITDFEKIITQTPYTVFQNIDLLCMKKYLLDNFKKGYIQKSIFLQPQYFQ